MTKNNNYNAYHQHWSFSDKEFRSVMDSVRKQAARQGAASMGRALLEALKNDFTLSEDAKRKVIKLVHDQIMVNFM